MPNFPFPKSAYYGYIGWAYAVAYWLKRRRFLGAAVGNWITFLALAFVFYVWVQGLGKTALILAILLFAFIQITFWRTARAGYNKFVVDETAVLPPPEASPPLPVYQRMPLWASGIFSVGDFEEHRLLYPAKYWHVPFGEHVIMVGNMPGNYRYQFFKTGTLQVVEPGWLIYGGRSRRTLAVTFLVAFGPSFKKPAPVTLWGDEQDPIPSKRRTIYFTLDDEVNFHAVWRTISQILP